MHRPLSALALCTILLACGSGDDSATDATAAAGQGGAAGKAGHAGSGQAGAKGGAAGQSAGGGQAGQGLSGGGQGGSGLSGGGQGGGPAGGGQAGGGQAGTGGGSQGGQGGQGGSGLSGGGQGGSGPAAAQVAVQLGPDVAPEVGEQIKALLQQASSRPVKVYGATEALPLLGSDSLVLAAGDTVATRALLPEAEVSALPAEGFALRSGTVSGAPALVTDGQPMAQGAHGNVGAHFGAFALLERVGFSFLHPLAPTLPADLPTALDPVTTDDAPRWPVRGMHFHTQHPLELTELLEGFGPGGQDDEAGWEAMLPEWDRFLTWMLANGQNRIQWPLLQGPDWKDFAVSPVRQARLKKVVARGQAFGLWVGMDAPVALEQQSSFRLMTDTSGDLAAEKASIRARLDYVMGTGLDYLATENGSTEFSAPDAARMLAWIDETATYLTQKYQASSLIKVHCSAGQEAKGFTDPATGGPLNFNFLPHYADPSMGVMPHSVQIYSLDDPAPTYHNDNFGYIRDFLRQEVGTRQTVWYPETSYWVSYDIDVPLFLPVYAHRRHHDLRLLAGDEDAGLMGVGANKGKHMDGQINFSSGWEWGYWLQEVVTARSAWNPHPEIVDEEAALSKQLDPIVRPFGAQAEAVRTVLVTMMKTQLDLLVLGKIKGKPPAEIRRRSGQAYLEGFDTSDDLAGAADAVPGITPPETQPGRLGPTEMRNPFHDPPGYSKEVEPLMAEMEAAFVQQADELAALAPGVPAAAEPLMADLVDSAHMTALRAVQMHGLYDYVDSYLDFSKTEAWRLARLKTARDALDAAAVIVAAREKRYRVPADRVAGWRTNPTAYGFGYLWTARSLYYWWRDEAKAVLITKSPCYMNVYDPAKIAFGEGNLVSVATVLSKLGGGFEECLSPPATEPVYPLDDLRSKP
jgi:hypothetical protein